MPAQRAVDLAVLSEDIGLDLVTFQDHPYQAVFHDTWTLLSWVAARTERIHVAGNVLNLPLRQPAVLARAAASLDLLSGGRFEMGIGAGGFYDAIAGMGGPLLTPPEAVSGVDEALDIVRGIWDVDDPSPLQVGGHMHHVDSPRRGPRPAHDIPIWVGAVKPRMQRIIGRKADGWLPSLPWLKPGDLARGNRTIDEAARQAGRAPERIVRLLNISARDRADKLAQLAIEDGTSVFIIASDDPDELRRFAEVTAKEIRERVAGARDAAGAPA
ncbi:LLM class flavin-dependent oxidoreductase [Promicromonospora sp. NPDC019610]|uniref:LLM class flavin-dependent oxidoreductase n=1 Tax=Promicromonospora sp. NPDC019610 TaxID=3364405 RepID=UPI00379C5A88